MAYYPIFLELHRRPCLVIGGGEVAYRKAKALVDCRAKVSVVSPRACASIKRLALKKKIVWRRHSFQASDLKGTELVVAATDRQPIHEKAARLAKARGIFINVVDQPRLCSFIVPSVVRRGKLVLAISTQGASPALSKWIRKDLERRYGPEFRRLLTGMARMRPVVLKSISNPRGRKELFERALAAYFNVVGWPVEPVGPVGRLRRKTGTTGKQA